MPKQHDANLFNAGVIIREALSSVRNFGVDRSLIEILKTVRHWPSCIDETDPDAFEPSFSATNISAKEETEDNVTVTSVSFTYLGATYDFVARIKEGSSNDDTIGNITLHENGDWAIDMHIVKNHDSEHFSFAELSAFRLGAWVENIVCIGAEIEQHNQLSGQSD